jgi:hypothetical protein
MALKQHGFPLKERSSETVQTAFIFRLKCYDRSMIWISILATFATSAFSAEATIQTQPIGKLLDQVTKVNSISPGKPPCPTGDVVPTDWDVFLKGASLISPTWCKAKTFEELCSAKKAFPALPPAGSTVKGASDLATVQLSDFYKKKKAYVEDFFEAKIKDPMILEACCGSDLSCRSTLASVKLSWIELGRSYPDGVGEYTGYSPANNTVAFSMRDQELTGAKYKEELETVIFHELGHACDHALFPKSKLGTYAAVEKIGGEKLAQCFLNPDPGGEYQAGLFGDVFKEPLAEIAFARFRPLIIQWKSCDAYMSNVGLKCLYSTKIIASKFCK